jgi:hypothetical protein
MSLNTTTGTSERAETTVTAELQNTTFLDEIPPNVEIPHGTVNARPQMPRTDIGEDQWNVHDMLSKPMRVFKGSWLTTDVPFVPKTLLPGNPTPTIITDILEANIESMQTNVLKSYTFLRFGVRFTMQLNSTKFYCGRFMMGYVPLEEKE